MDKSMLYVRYYLLFPLLFLFKNLISTSSFFEVSQARLVRTIAVLLAFSLPTSNVNAESKEQVTRGLSWLQAQVQLDGSLQSEANSIASSLQVRSEALQTLKLLSAPTNVLSSLQAALNSSNESHTEALARRAQALGLSGIPQAALLEQLLLRQNSNGGYGGDLGYSSHALDTAFVLQAQKQSNSVDLANVSKAITYLKSAQGSDGSFAINRQPNVYTTANSMLAAASWTNQTSTANITTPALQWLLAQRNSAMHYGNTLDNALALWAISGQSSQLAILQALADALKAEQQANGSWNDDPYLTALALRALYLSNDATPPAPTSAAISGLVLDSSTGRALADVSITVLNQSKLNGVISAANGSFSFTSVTPGTLSLQFSKLGYANKEVQVNALVGQTVNLPSISLVATPLAASLSGTVKDYHSGNPVANVVVSVGTLSAVTNAQGFYQISGINSGRATIKTLLVYYQSMSIDLDFVAGTSYTFSPQILASGYTPPNTTTLSGIVIDATTNNPIAGASVNLGGAVQTTAADGSFNFANATAGQFALSISANTYLPTTLTGVMVLGKNNVGKLSVKRAPTSSSLNGVVVDVTSKLPIAGALISVQGQNVSMTTDLDGKYSLSALTGTQFTLNISAKNYQSQTQTVSLTQIGSAVVDVKLQVQSAANSDINFIKVATDTSSYAASSTIALEMQLANSANTSVSAVVSAQVLDAQNSVVYEYLASPYNTGTLGAVGNNPVTLGANSTLELHLDWGTVRLPVGNYQIHAFAKDASGRVLAEGDASFSVTQTSAFSGGVTADPPLAQMSPGTSIAFSADLNNAGNVTLPAGQVQLRVYLENADVNQITKVETSLKSIFAQGLPMKEQKRLINDAQGNFYTLNGLASQQIIKIDPAGTQSVYATVPGQYNVDLTMDRQGDLWVADRDRPKLYKVTPSGVVASYTVSSLTELFAIEANPSGGLYLSGTYSFQENGQPMVEARLIARDMNGQESVLWKNGLIKPVGLIKDSFGNFVVTNSGDGSIVKISPVNGQITPFVRGLVQPKTIIQDASGHYLVADAGANKIVKITPEGVVSTYASGLNKPYGLKFGPDGLLYVSNEGDNTIVKVAADGNVSLFAHGIGSLATAMKYDEQGNLWLVDGERNLRKKDAQDNFTLVSTGVRGEGMAIAANGDILLADYNNASITRVSQGVKSTFASGLAGPRAIAISGNGDVYVSEYSPGRIARFDSQGNKLGVIETALRKPGMMRTAANGDVYIKNDNFLSVKRGDTVQIAVRNFNYGVWAVDSVNGGLVAVSSNSVLRISENGIVTTLKAALPFTPNAIAVDGAGNVILGDPANAKLQKLDSAGNLTEFVKLDFANYSNDIHMDLAGNLVIRLTNLAFKKISPQGVVSAIDHKITENLTYWSLDRNNHIVTTAHNKTYRINTDTAASEVVLANRGNYLESNMSGIAVDGVGKIVIADNYGASILSMYQANADLVGQVYGFDSVTDIIWAGNELRFIDTRSQLFGFNGMDPPIKKAGSLPGSKLAQVGNVTYSKDSSGDINKWTGIGKGYEVFGNFGAGIHVGSIAAKADGTLAIGVSSENTLKIVDANKKVLKSFANINVPQGLAFDAAGRLYVANYMGHSVVRFDSLTNNNSYEFAHVGTAQDLQFDGAGNLYVTASPGVVRLDKNGIATQLDNSLKLRNFLLDGNNVWGVDIDKGQLLKFSMAASGNTTIVFSSGVAGPVALRAKANGDLFILNKTNNTVAKFAAGKLETVATIPSGMNTMANTSDGGLLVAGNAGVLNSIDKNGRVENIAMGPLVDSSNLQGVVELTDGRIFLSSLTNASIYEVLTLKPAIPPAPGSLVFESSAAIAEMQANGEYARIAFSSWKPSFGGDFRFEVTRDGIAGKTTNFIHIGAGASGTLSVARSVLPAGDSSLQMCMDLKGGDFTSMSRVEVGQVRSVSNNVERPSGMTGDKQGNLYVTDTTSLYKTNASGQSELLASGMNLAFGLAIDSQQKFYVASKNPSTSRFDLIRIDLAGNKTVVADLGVSVANGVQVNSKDEILVGSPNKLLKVDKNGVVTVVSTLGLPSPRGIAVDGKDNVYVQNNDNHFVSMIKPDGTTKHIFSNGDKNKVDPEFEGDGFPTIAADCAENMFIAPSVWSRINQNGEEHTIVQIVPHTGQVATLFDTLKIHPSISDIDYLSFDRFNNRLLMWNEILADKRIWQAPVTCGAIGVKATLVASVGQVLSNASKPPSATVSRADGRTEYVWSLSDVTAQGSQVCFVASEKGLKLGEERSAIDSGFISFQNSFVANDVTVPLTIPKVRVGNLLDLNVVSDRVEYAANTTAQISTTLRNTNLEAVEGELNVQVFDSKNALVSSVTQQRVSLAGNESLPVMTALEIGSIIPAQYTIKARLIGAQGDVAAAQSQFTVLPSNLDASVRASVVTDRKLYNGSDKVVISSRVTSQSANLVLENLNVTINVLDAAGSSLFNQSYQILQLLPGASRDFVTTQMLRNLPKGSYTVKQSLSDSQGRVYSEASSIYAVETSANTGFGLQGSLSLSAKEIAVGENLNLSYQAKNAGNSDLSSVAMKMLVIDPASQTILAQLPLSNVNLAIGQQITANANWLANGTPGQSVAIALIATLAGKDITLASDHVTLGMPLVRISGSVQISPKELEVGQSVALAAHISNAGRALQGLGVQLNVKDAQTAALVYSASKTVDIAAGANWSQAFDFKPSGAAGTQYLVNLQAQATGKTFELAQDSFVMIAPKLKLDVTQQLGSWQNLLVLSSCKRAADDLLGQCGATPIPAENAATLAKCDADRVLATQKYLAGLGVGFKVTSSAREFQDELRSGMYNTYWLSNGATAGAAASTSAREPIASEIKAATLRGEGFMMDGISAGSNALLTQCAGVQFSGKYPVGNYTLNLADSLLSTGSAGTGAEVDRFPIFSLPVKLAASNGAQVQGKLASSDGVISGQSGDGKTLSFGFDLAETLRVQAADQRWKTVTQKSLRYLEAKPLQGNEVASAQVFNLATKLNNPGAAVKVKVVQTLPLYTQIVAVEPDAVLDMVVPAGEEMATALSVTWTLDLAANSDTKLNLRLRQYDTGTMNIDTKTSLLSSDSNADNSDSGTLYKQQNFVLNVMSASEMLTQFTQTAALTPTSNAAQLAAKEAVLSSLARAQASLAANQPEVALRHLLAVQTRLAKMDSDGKLSAALARVISAVEFLTLAS